MNPSNRFRSTMDVDHTDFFCACGQSSERSWSDAQFTTWINKHVEHNPPEKAAQALTAKGAAWVHDNDLDAFSNGADFKKR